MRFLEVIEDFTGIDWGYYAIGYWPHIIFLGFVLNFLMHISDEYGIDLFEWLRRQILRLFGKKPPKRR